ncbi:MAG TPA: crossover junction endodeoxyribonuclease RuvC, partial [Sutterella sp.]|nr:crossover junction endodeoxyribonuclease RuvC [Sutterella sp.]
MRILGIDPGLIHTGFGVIDVAGPKVTFVKTGVINVPKGELAQRLAFIFREVDAVAKDVKPDLAACEKVFVNMNGASTLLLGQARGAALTALAFNNLTVREFNPTEIKISVVGAG